MTTTMRNKPIYRMSEAGRCAGALSAIRQGYTPEAKPAWLETAAEEGNWHEQRIKDELRADDIAVVAEQEEVRLDYPKFTLVGHVDGHIYDHSDVPKLLEIKSMSQFEFDRWMKEGFKGFPTYEVQLACYMAATKLEECLYIVKNRSSGYQDRRIVNYRQRNDLGYNMQDIVDATVNKITEIEDFLARWIDPGAREGTYPAEFNPNSLECKRCEYKHLCAVEPKELTPIEEAGLNAASEDWRAGKALVERGEYLINKAKEVFESHTKATGLDKWRWAELSIMLIRVKESIGYPKEKLLKTFTEEQLKPASIVKLPYEYVRVDDLQREEDR